MSFRSREGEVANGRFGASNFTEPSFADWPLSGNRYVRFRHGMLYGDRLLLGSEVPLAAFRQ